MLIIPAIDLRDGCCVRLTQGRRDSTKVYDGNPVNIARGYEAAGAEMLHVVDLDGAFSEPNSRNRRRCERSFGRSRSAYSLGEGCGKLEDVQKAIDLGVARVVLGTLQSNQLKY